MNTCLYANENDPHVCRVYRAHWNDGTLDERSIEDVDGATVCRAGKPDLFCGGFPCTDLSVAGLRAGLSGERSGLWYQFHRLLREVRPSWVVIENVPGLLSSTSHDAPSEVPPPDDLEPGQEWSVEEDYEADEASDFGIILSGLAELGYRVAARVFDAQYAGVAQVRRRVFIVGHIGSGRAASVLFEPEGLCWDPPTRGGAGQVAPTLPASGAGTARTGNERTEAGLIQTVARRLRARPNASHRADSDTYIPAVVAAPLTARQGKGGFTDPVNDNVICVNGRQDPVHGDQAGTLDGMHPQAQCVCFEARYARNGRGKPAENVPTLKAENGRTGKGDGAPLVSSEVMVPRRLLPIECCRLQGFPDNWTAFYDDGTEVSDTQRYRMIGNAVPVTITEWLGRRIAEANGGSFTFAEFFAGIGGFRLGFERALRPSAEKHNKP